VFDMSCTGGGGGKKKEGGKTLSLPRKRGRERKEEQKIFFSSMIRGGKRKKKEGEKRKSKGLCSLPMILRGRKKKRRKEPSFFCVEGKKGYRRGNFLFSLRSEGGESGKKGGGRGKGISSAFDGRQKGRGGEGKGDFFPFLMWHLNREEKEEKSLLSRKLEGEEEGRAKVPRNGSQQERKKKKGGRGKGKHCPSPALAEERKRREGGKKSSLAIQCQRGGKGWERRRLFCWVGGPKKGRRGGQASPPPSPSSIEKMHERRKEGGGRTQQENFSLYSSTLTGRGEGEEGGGGVSPISWHVEGRRGPRSFHFPLLLFPMIISEKKKGEERRGKKKKGEKKGGAFLALYSSILPVRCWKKKKKKRGKGVGSKRPLSPPAGGRGKK